VSLLDRRLSEKKRRRGNCGILEKFHMEIGSALFTEIMVCLDGIFISDAHALAVLPNVTHFALDEELPCAFVIVTCEPREHTSEGASGMNG